jgi:hypothetical protein
MTEEKQTPSSAGDVWQDVGQQFKALGESLATAFKSTWESEETRQHLEKMQAGLEAVVDEISQATQKVADSEEAQKVKVEVEKAAQSAQAAGQEALEEVKPHLLAAFQKIKVELDQIISRMEQAEASPEAPGPEASGAEDEAVD